MSRNQQINECSEFSYSDVFTNGFKTRYSKKSVPGFNSSLHGVKTD